MLLLFDIDCTLVNTGGAGMGALNKAALEVFGSEGPPLDLAGSTDSGIVRGLFEHFKMPYDAALEEEFYQVYLPMMQRNLNEPSFGGRILAGVPELLASLEEGGHTLGLMTGNIERGAIIKSSHYGLAEHFGFGSYGDDHWDRNKLGPIALARAEKASGKKFAPDEILVIGDTPKDVACAHAFGVKCVAVATGAFDEEQLATCGADRVVPDLVGFQI
ncbi:MAG: phosphoglycolate phosphatase-like HAD superfamily hydrolase [Akkermansiaceae bacterium]|jgi:phosphoglycolate phosphatase